MLSKLLHDGVSAVAQLLRALMDLKVTRGQLETKALLDLRALQDPMAILEHRCVLLCISLVGMTSAVSSLLVPGVCW